MNMTVECISNLQGASMIKKSYSLLLLPLLLIGTIGCECKDRQYEKFVEGKTIVLKEDSLQILVNDQYYNKGAYAVNDHYLIALEGLTKQVDAEYIDSGVYMDKYIEDGDLLIKYGGVDTFLVVRGRDTVKFHYNFEYVFGAAIKQ